jgi:heterotetrameric sarcosine oxidase gamma subunit
MADVLSPLEPNYHPGRYGNMAREAGVVLSEMSPGSIVQVAAWPGQSAALCAAITRVTGLEIGDTPGSGAVGKTASAFGIAPERYLMSADEEGLDQKAASVVTADIGTVTDLSHGRTLIRIEGPAAEWVLAKLFAIDFEALPVESAVSANHHEIFAQIQRSGANRFDLYVFRSFARSFWTVLCNAAEETGYMVI